MNRHVTPPVIGLSVGDAVELAKAGVKVELAGQVHINPAPPPDPNPVLAHGNDISQGIRERYVHSQRAKQTRDKDFGYTVVPQMCAFQHDDKVYVFAYSGTAEPEIIVDDANVYPSDALLARIHLMMQYGK